jgi:hypothetical protein
MGGGFPQAKDFLKTPVRESEPFSTGVVEALFISYCRSENIMVTGGKKGLKPRLAR